MRSDALGTPGHWAIRRLAAAGLMGLVAVLSVACGGTGAPPGSQTTVKATVATGSVVTIEHYSLYTHCGIDEALITGKYYEAVRPLSDGQGNPPPGWGNPYQIGTMTLIAPNQAAFTDPAGHRVIFRLRPGATSFRHVCS